MQILWEALTSEGNEPGAQAGAQAGWLNSPQAANESRQVRQSVSATVQGRGFVINPKEILREGVAEPKQEAQPQGKYAHAAKLAGI